MSNFWRGVVGLLVLGLGTGCGAMGEELPTYRYRLTVEVTTPEGLRSGSSVIEVKTRRYGEEALPDQRGFRSKVEGEAVAVDLGKRGFLFAALRTRDFEGWPQDVLRSVLPPMPNTGGDVQRQTFEAMLGLKGVHVIPRTTGQGRMRVDNYPLLVRFGDVRQPQTATIVDPDNLSASFGAGVSLRRITVARTDAAVTHSLASRLPFLQAEPTGAVDRTFENSPANKGVGLARYHFIRTF